MGSVYSAWDELLLRPVALKRLTSASAVESEALVRALSEARAAARAVHPNTVRVFDVLVEDAVVTIVFEHLEGEDLRALLRRRGRLRPSEAVELMEPVVDALAATHEGEVLHRDVKPENIFLASRAGRSTPVLIDFGIAASACSAPDGLRLGTPRYMAPERLARDAREDRRSEVWSVGATLYECVAGRPPFLGDDAEEVAREIAASPPPPLRSLAPEVPVALAAVIERCLARDPAARYDDMLALRNALRNALRPSARPRLALAFTAAVALTAAAIAARHLRPSAPPERSAPIVTLLAVPRVASSGPVAPIVHEAPAAPAHATAAPSVARRAPVASVARCPRRHWAELGPEDFTPDGLYRPCRHRREGTRSPPW